MEPRQRRNFKAKEFQTVDASYLRRDVLLQSGERVSFVVSGFFLSVLEASPGRFIDFDEESGTAIEKVGRCTLPTGIDLIYIDNIGFDDPSEYEPRPIS